MKKLRPMQVQVIGQTRKGEFKRDDGSISQYETQDCQMEMSSGFPQPFEVRFYNGEAPYDENKIYIVERSSFQSERGKLVLKNVTLIFDPSENSNKDIK
jgi:hypothetical protein